MADNSKFWAPANISLEGDGLQQLAERFNLLLHVIPDQPPLDSPADLPIVGDGDSSWPPTYTSPTAEMPYFCDGNYGAERFRVSPEGNVYGHRRRFSKWQHLYWWTGSEWLEVEIKGSVQSVESLPVDPRPFGEIWTARRYVLESNEYVWDLYFWDSTTDEFKLLKRYWTVDNFTDLPNPGRAIGELHAVVETDCELFWDGFQWRRERHSRLEDDEPGRHLPAGFLEMVSPDARVVFVSPTEISLEAVTGGSGLVWVNGEFIKAERTAAVTNKLPALTPGGAGILPADLQLETEYWIYLANNKDAAFNVAGWDFRGKLFLCMSAAVDGYLNDTGPGRNARLVGKIQTDATPVGEGGPLFLRELNISLISQTANISETLRDYSDYQIQFVDDQTLKLALLDGAYGQIYVGGSLHYLGAEYDVTTSDPWISWNPADPDRIARETGPLANDLKHFVYIAGDADAFNLNAVNSATNRPWTANDAGSEDYYDATLDMRLKPFLSPKSPDHGRLAEEWPGYVTRCLGSVQVDDQGRFWLTKAIASNLAVNDAGASLTETWSSARSKYEVQKLAGLGLTVTFPDSGTMLVMPDESDTTIALPGGRVVIIPDDGLTLDYDHTPPMPTFGPCHQPMTGMSSPSPLSCASSVPNADIWKLFDGDYTTAPARYDRGADGTENYDITFGATKSVYAVIVSTLVPSWGSTSITIQGKTEEVDDWVTLYASSQVYIGHLVWGSSPGFSQIMFLDAVLPLTALRVIAPCSRPTTDYTLSNIYIYEDATVIIPKLEANPYFGTLQGCKPTAYLGYAGAVAPRAFDGSSATAWEEYVAYQPALAIIKSSPDQAKGLPPVNCWRLRANAAGNNFARSVQLWGTSVTALVAPMSLLPSAGWTLLDERLDLTEPGAGGYSDIFRFDPEWRHNAFALKVLEGHGASLVSISEWQLFAQMGKYVYLTVDGLEVSNDAPDREYQGFSALGSGRIMLCKM